MAKKTQKARQKKQMRSKERKRQKRQKKQQQQPRQSGAPSGTPQEHSVPGGPGELDVPAPEGFRAAGMSQALMEYMRPLLDRAGESADMNNVLSLGMLVYNYALAQEKGETPEYAQEDILLRIGGELGLGPEKSKELLQEMVERKQYLLPDELQTNLSGNIMFVRKTEPLEIPDPDPAKLPSEIVAPEDSQDLEELFSCLDLLELSRKHNNEPEDYHNLQERLPALAASCFEDWLRESDPELDPETPGQFVRMFVDFVYGYLPPDVGHFREHGLPPEGHREFLFQHLTRKLYLKDPNEFAYAPVAIYLFYCFLLACEWLDKEAIEAALEVHELEEEFLEMLRRDYS